MRIKTDVRSVLAAVVLALGCSHAPDSTSGPITAETSALRVTPIQPTRKTLVRKIQQSGEVHAFEHTPLYAKVAGYIDQMHVDIGDRVDADQLLIEISIPEYEQELKQKQALVAQAAAETKQAQSAIKVAKSALTSAQALATEAEAGVERYAAEYQRATSEVERVTTLFSNKSVTQKILDEAQAAQRAAHAAHTQAQARVISARAVVAEKEAGIEQANADAEAIAARENVARADQERLEAVHEYTRITAPYKSVVTDRNIDSGYLVQAGSGGQEPLLVVMQADRVRVVLDVPEADASLISPGSSAVIRVPASGLKVEGHVSRTSWSLDRATRTLQTQIDVPNADGQLRPGMYVIADLKVAERENALALPWAAVAFKDQQASCLVVNAESKIVQVPITTGIRAGDEIEILSGLKGTEAVIPGNLAAYKEGQVVELVPPKK